MSLWNAQIGTTSIIRSVKTEDPELDAFLFTLGCYVGAPITLISRRRGGCTVSIQDGRYHMDNHLAQAIILEQ